LASFGEKQLGGTENSRERIVELVAQQFAKRPFGQFVVGDCRTGFGKQGRRAAKRLQAALDTSSRSRQVGVVAGNEIGNARGKERRQAFRRLVNAENHHGRVTLQGRYDIGQRRIPNTDGR
jgi:hypothetical protein